MKIDREKYKKEYKTNRDRVIYDFCLYFWKGLFQKTFMSRMDGGKMVQMDFFSFKTYFLLHIFSLQEKCDSGGKNRPTVQNYKYLKKNDISGHQ